MTDVRDLLIERIFCPRAASRMAKLGRNPKGHAHRLLPIGGQRVARSETPPNCPKKRLGALSTRGCHYDEIYLKGPMPQYSSAFPLRLIKSEQAKTSLGSSV